jgi:hypothetical protein
MLRCPNHRWIRWLAVAAMGFFSQPAFSQVIASSRFEGWVINSFRSASTGQFTHCAASATYNSGVSLLFSVNHRFDWNMGFASSAWNLQPGTQIPITYAIDALPPRTATASVVASNHVVAPLPDDTRLFQQMRAGLRMFVTGGGQSLGFNLTRTSLVLGTLLECARDQGRTVNVRLPNAAQSAPLPAAPPSPSVGGVTADMRVDATQFVANLLSSANMQGFRILTRADLQGEHIPPFVRASVVAWQGTASIGTLHIITNVDPRDLDKPASDIIASDARACVGEFATGRTADAEMTNVRRLHTICRASNGSLETISYILIPMPGRLVYQLSTLVPLARSEAEHEDLRLRDAVHAVINRHPAFGPSAPPASRPSSPQPDRRL